MSKLDNPPKKNNKTNKTVEKTVYKIAKHNENFQDRGNKRLLDIITDD